MDLSFFTIMHFPLKRRDSFLFLKNHFKNGLEPSLIFFVLFLKRKQNKKEKL